jgi:pimeloyl-ACP methyl ester carboxylesterase
MGKNINKILVFAAAIFLLAGCKGLGDLAQNVLYPAEQVNKKYPVQEVPPTGLNEVWFPLKTSDNVDYKVHGWFFRNKNIKSNTIVYLHGNGENLQTMHISNFLGVMKQLDANFIVIDYPTYGRSTGPITEETAVAGTLAAIDFAAKNFSGDVILWGRSLGAGVAVQAFAKAGNNADRLVLTSPWTNFFEAAVVMSKLAKQIPKDWLAKNSYESVKTAKLINKPVLIHHGLVDKLIPITQGRKVAASFPNKEIVTMIEFDKREHNDIFQEAGLWESVHDFSH